MTVLRVGVSSLQGPGEREGAGIRGCWSVLELVGTSRCRRDWGFSTAGVSRGEMLGGWSISGQVGEKEGRLTTPAGGGGFAECQRGSPELQYPFLARGYSLCKEVYEDDLVLGCLGDVCFKDLGCRFQEMLALSR